MKTGVKVLLIVVGIIVLIGVGGCQFYSGNYNKMVELEEQVSGAWAQVQNVYQRRMDLIPNLVETVKGYAAHESQVYSDIAEARSKVGGVVQISAADLEDPAKLQQFQEAQNSLGGALQRLLSVTENLRQTRISWLCRISWREQKIESLWNEVDLTRPLLPTIPSSVSSPRTSLLT